MMKMVLKVFALPVLPPKETPEETYSRGKVSVCFSAREVCFWVQSTHSKGTRAIHI